MKKFQKLKFVYLFLFAIIFLNTGCNSDLESLIEPKTHIGRLSQEGENPPVEYIMKNTLELEITWTRVSAGKYKGVLNHPIDLNTTTIFNTNIGTSGVNCYFKNSSEIELNSTCGANAFCDNFDNLNLQITSYSYSE